MNTAYPPHTLDDIEQAALDRLTDDRRTNGPLPPEAEESLHLAGVFWDEEADEYISITRLVSDHNMNILQQLLPEN